MKAMLEAALVDKDGGTWDLVLTVDDGGGSRTTRERSEGRRSGAITKARPMLSEAGVPPEDAFKMLNKLARELGRGAESTKVANFEVEPTLPSRLTFDVRRQITDGKKDGWIVALNYDTAVRETWTAGARKDALEEAKRMLLELGLGVSDVQEIVKKLAHKLAGNERAHLDWRKE